jgi:hypothetical protein
VQNVIIIRETFADLHGECVQTRLVTIFVDRLRLPPDVLFDLLPITHNDSS